MKLYWIIDEESETLDGITTLTEVMIRYTLESGCPGDYATAPDPPRVHLEEPFYRISRGNVSIDAPIVQLHHECLDLDSVEDDIFNHHFPNY